MSRLEVRAPVGGIVYGSTVFAQQAVIQSAEPLMYVIPQDQPLIVSARVEAILDPAEVAVFCDLLQRFTQNLNELIDRGNAAP